MILEASPTFGSHFRLMETFLFEYYLLAYFSSLKAEARTSEVEARACKFEGR